MKTLTIEGTPKTPMVKFDGETGKIEIKGRSIPENSIEFYKPLVEWLDEYADVKHSEYMMSHDFGEELAGM